MRNKLRGTVTLCMAVTVFAHMDVVEANKNLRVSDFGAACEAMNVRWPLIAIMATPIQVLADAEFSIKEPPSDSQNHAMARAFTLLDEGYDFIHTVIGIDSIDDHGQLLKLYTNVHFNPKWDGIQCHGDEFNGMWYQPSQALYITADGPDFPEVILHELGHGITGNGSQLAYAFEPGALNESIADAIGVSFRIWLELGKQSTNVVQIPKQYWQIRAPGGRILRNMADPASKGGPDHYADLARWPMERDNGGVHINASIINLAFYLLAEGGPHPRRTGGPVVRGIGVFKAVEIYALSTAGILQRQSDFKDARYAFAQAAELLYGKNSAEWRAVHMSMDAVGVPGNWPSGNVTEEKPIPVSTQPKPASEPSEPQQPSQSKTAPVPKPIEAPDKPVKVPPVQKQKQSSNAKKTGDGKRVPDESRLPAPESGFNVRQASLILLALAALTLLATAMFKLRPKYQPQTPDALGNQPAPVPMVRKKARPTEPIQASVSPRVIGHLRALDSADNLPLFKALLISEEGQIIGRSLELSHIVLSSDPVSRRHARLRLIKGEMTIEDLNSSYGTSVDGQKLKPFEPHVLRKNNIVHIAPHGYRVIFV